MVSFWLTVSFPCLSEEAQLCQLLVSGAICSRRKLIHTYFLFAVAVCPIFCPHSSIIGCLGVLSGSPVPVCQVIYSMESHKLAFHITFNAIEISKCVACEWHFLLSSSTSTGVFVSYSIVISLASGSGGDLNIYTHSFLFPLKNIVFRSHEVLSPIIGTTGNPLKVVSQIFSLH